MEAGCGIQFVNVGIDFCTVKLLQRGVGDFCPKMRTWQLYAAWLIGYGFVSLIRTKEQKSLPPMENAFQHTKEIRTLGRTPPLSVSYLNLMFFSVSYCDQSKSGRARFSHAIDNPMDAQIAINKAASKLLVIFVYPLVLCKVAVNSVENERRNKKKER
ncbi:hypothetical protein SCA6_017882 [Theobroma cacao]